MTFRCLLKVSVIPMGFEIEVICVLQASVPAPYFFATGPYFVLARLPKLNQFIYVLAYKVDISYGTSLK